MIDGTQSSKQDSSPVVTTILFWALILVAILLLACAFALSFKLWRMPKYVDPVYYVRLMQATLLTYGLGIGLFGSTVALYAPEHQRRFGTAATVHGFGFVVLSFAARSFIERGAMGYAPSKLPLLLPAAILVFSIALFLHGWLYSKPIPGQEETSNDATKEEQPQPLSQP